ncbi:methylsterol monooxygenase 1-1-like [Gossypium australe]|uniref:Methylsterol monooxygenase 1-1-like n=1 Tax=Gossypium australe TaxID=47621 RepID=A0A5B6UE22_9ROSI|nr:methylsterol monooxygenase 1-1-like [Gossypium australe]
MLKQLVYLSACGLWLSCGLRFMVYGYHGDENKLLPFLRKSGSLLLRYDFPWTPTRFIPFYGGADYHDYHHYVGGQSQSNFASVFTYCDYIYGTDKGYRYHKKVLRKLKEGSKVDGAQNGGSYYYPTQDLKSE